MIIIYCRRKYLSFILFRGQKVNKVSKSYGKTALSFLRSLANKDVWLLFVALRTRHESSLCFCKRRAETKLSLFKYGFLEHLQSILYFSLLIFLDRILHTIFIRCSSIHSNRFPVLYHNSHFFILFSRSRESMRAILLHG
jgi:hypothetical protein